MEVASSAAGPSLIGNLLFVLLVAVPLAFVVSFALLAIYQSAVKRSMRRQGAPAIKSATGRMRAIVRRRGSPPAHPLAIAWHDDVGLTADAASAAAMLRHAAVYVAAGLAFAVVMAMSYLLAGRLGFDWLVAVFLTLFYAWPIAITVCVTVTISWLGVGLVVLAYALALGIVAAAAIVGTSITPAQLLTVWWNGNAEGTLLALCFLAPPIRAVGPLVAAFMIAAVAGAIGIVLAAGASPAFLQWVATVGTVLHLGVVGTSTLLLLSGAAITGILGWLLLVWLGYLYRSRRISDQMLLIDAVWLMFTVQYGIGLMHLQPLWFLAAVCAFAAFKIVQLTGFRLVREDARSDADAPRLLLLRVFSLGARSQRLFESFARRWRYAGTMRMIAGPDLATSTVEPHEFLDFLAGRLQRRFIADRSTLETRIAETDEARDCDGRFRVADYFCHDDTWQMTLVHLARDSDAVLMDLRGFSLGNRGCIFEIEELLDVVALHRVVFLVDRTTDELFLTQVLVNGWAGIGESSPNRGDPSPRIHLYRLDDHLGRTVPRLVALLKDAGAHHVRHAATAA